jgi:Domain of unknown function (DUF4282)
LLSGIVYTSWASHCDFSPYTGWIMGYNQKTLAQTTVLNLTPNGSEASIWQSGGGLAADSQGNIYALMANGTFETTLDANGFPNKQDYGNAFVKVSTAGGALKVADYFDMSNTVSESGHDTDLGSSGPMLLPDLNYGTPSALHLAVGAGKDGNIYIVDRTNLGKFSPTSNNMYQELAGAVANGVYGAPAYFNSTVYYCDAGGTLKSFSISNGKLSTTPVQTGASFTYPGILPSVSANGTSNGIVWGIENTGTAVLHAFKADDLTQELYNSNQAASGRDHFGAGNKFVTPMIADGKVFAATANSVAVFGLLPQLSSLLTSRLRFQKRPVRMASYFFEQGRPLGEEARSLRLCTMGVPARKILIRRTRTMATAPSYVEQHAIPRENGIIENLMDFSFQRLVTPRILKLLYGVHLLIGLIAAVWFIFSGFQQSTSNGLLALILGFAAMLLWIVYCRVAVELLAAIFQASQVITNSQH